jgi:serine-type D-Ala-D-Ala carboxypeptidase (penicillin-binding protein 5/6)
VQIRVPRQAVIVGGTSAFLRVDDVLSLQDLIYGLMLPSGNDAAIAIANWGGEMINSLANLKREELINRNRFRGTSSQSRRKTIRSSTLAIE